MMMKMMQNSNDLGPKCLEKYGQLIQRVDPIYLNPTNKYGRAHFLAPNKNLFGNLIPTYWFNILVVWLMSVILMLTLYFDLLKKLLDTLGVLLEKILPKKLKKKIA